MNEKDQQKKEGEAKQREFTEQIARIAKNGKKARMVVIQNTQQIGKP